MKKLLNTKLILLGLVLLLTACKKESAIQTPSAPGEDPSTVRVENNQVSIKLIALHGFPDPCFNMSFNSVLRTSFRFTGSAIHWDFKDLAPGIHSYSFTCFHECTHENGSEKLKFQIYDGQRYYEVSTKETGHCRYAFWLHVN